MCRSKVECPVAVARQGPAAAGRAEAAFCSPLLGQECRDSLTMLTAASARERIQTIRTGHAAHGAPVKASPFPSPDLIPPRPV